MWGTFAMHPSIPILLAPAGSFDALIAACAAGADAVYLEVADLVHVNLP
jgi:collagenase-like PrtC family protease